MKSVIISYHSRFLNPAKATEEQLSYLEERKKIRRKPKNRAEFVVENATHYSPLHIRVELRKFLIEFLERCYNNFAHSAKVLSIMNYMWIIKYTVNSCGILRQVSMPPSTHSSIRPSIPTSIRAFMQKWSLWSKKCRIKMSFHQKWENFWDFRAQNGKSDSKSGEFWDRNRWGQGRI